MASRILVDPLAWPYYSVWPLVGAALLDVSRGRRVPWFSIITAAVFYLPDMVNHGADVTRLIWSAGILVVGAIRLRGGVKPARLRFADAEMASMA